MKDYTTLIEPFSAREHEILSFIDKGLSYGKIGQALHIEKATVTWYVQQICDKLGLEKSQCNHRKALLCARALGLLEVAPNTFSSEQHEPYIKHSYRVLRAFQQADARDFFGRDALTQRFLTRLAILWDVATGGELSRFDLSISTNAWAVLPPSDDTAIIVQDNTNQVIEWRLN